MSVIVSLPDNIKQIEATVVIWHHTHTVTTCQFNLSPGCIHVSRADGFAAQFAPQCLMWSYAL